MVWYVFVYLSLIVVVKSSEVDWCSPSLMCRFKDQVYQHTMCVYVNQTNTPRCKNITNVQSYPGRFELLKKHNQLRESVATGKISQWPPAAAMRKLTYDNVLEKVAYRWATQCEVRRDDCRKTKRWPVVGQNVYELKKDAPIDYKMWNPASVVDDWFEGIYLARPQTGDSYDGQETSFAQMIHDKTEKIGCADVQYEVVGTDEPRYRRMIVCNYGPGVDLGSSRLYEEGPTCSECPPGVRCLCGGRVLAHQESDNTNTSTIQPPSGDEASSSSDDEADDSSLSPSTSSDTDSSSRKQEVDTAPPDTPPPPTNSSTTLTVDFAGFVDDDPFKFTGIRGSPLIPSESYMVPTPPSSWGCPGNQPSSFLIVMFISAYSSG